ncbi:hypothetical protein ES703_18831 [subsurface metagenome]
MAFVEFQKKHKTVFALIDNTGSGTVNSDFFSMSKAHHIAIVIIAGTLANDVVLTIRESIIPGAAPGGDKAIASKTVTMGVAESDSIKILEVEASELDLAGGFKNISLRSAAVGACEISAVIIKWPLRYSPLV